MTDYHALASALQTEAPSQARVLDHVLAHPGQTTPQILAALDVKDPEFRRIVGRLRDRGVELIVTRVPIDPENKVDAEYRWSVRSGEPMEHWAGGRKSAVMTSWHRVQSMMTTYLRSLDTLDIEDRGRILNTLEIVSDLIIRTDLRIAAAHKAAVAIGEESRQLTLAAE